MARYTNPFKKGDTANLPDGSKGKVLKKHGHYIEVSILSGPNLKGPGVAPSKRKDKKATIKSCFCS